MSILVLGTVALDSVKTPFGKRSQMLGGSAVHFAMSARLFTDVNLVAIVGEDFPLKYLDFLQEKGINLTSLIKTKGETFRWRGEYRDDLNVAITLNTELGVLLDFKPDVSHRERHIRNIFLANVDPDLQHSLLKRMHAPSLVGLDSMNYWIRHKRNSLLRLLKKVNIYVANDQEARELSGEHNLIKAAQALHRRGPDMILIKKGEHGVTVYSDKMIFSIPAFPTTKVIDPTGAGDTFAGGFMGYLSRLKRVGTKDIKKAVAYGTIAASFNVEGFGTEKTSTFTLREVESRLKFFKKCISL